MELSIWVGLLPLFYLVAINDQVDATIVKSYCLLSQPTNEFKFVIRLNREGNTAITGIAAVTQVAVPVEVSSCKSTTLESTDIFVLSRDVDIDDSTLPCGMTNSGSAYVVHINAIGTNEYFSITCDTSSLLPSTVSVTNFATHGMTNVVDHKENEYGVKFQVFHADESNAPARNVDLGENIFLRLIYNTGHHGLDSDNWGMVFHTGFIEHLDDSKMSLLIVTEGLGTSVHITGRLATMVIDEWITVKRDHWMEFEIPYKEYHQTGSSTTNWAVETRGLKIESLHDQIGVIARGVNNDGTDSFAVLPDDVLQTDYKPFLLNNILICDFETVDICGFSNRASDNDDWNRNTGGTSSLNTGPNGDHTTGSGYYMYIEATRMNQNDNALLGSLPFLSNGNQHLSFWYSMYGNPMGTLNVYVEDNGVLGTPIFTDSTDKGTRAWFYVCLPIAKVSSNARIVFEGIDTTNSYRSDIAIDDVTIGTGKCIALDTPATTVQQILVVATQAGSDVTLTYDPFTLPGLPSSLTVDGNSVASGSSTTSVTLDEYEVLHVICYLNCETLQLQSSASIAVIYELTVYEPDNDDTKGASTTQVTPAKYYSDKYIMIDPLYGDAEYIFGTDDPTDTSVDISHYSVTNSPYTQRGVIDWGCNCDPSTEVTFSKPVAVYLHVTSATEGSLALVQYPSIAQWGVYYSFPIEEGVSYSIQIVTWRLLVDHVTIRVGDVTTDFTGPTISDDPKFSANLSPVHRLFADSGLDKRYEVYTNEGGFDVIDTDPNKIEKGIVELTSSSLDKPFMLLVYEKRGDITSLRLPIGVRYPPQNPCTPTIGRSGDNIDNDCDGLVDEEIANGADDDDEDVLVDEDTALLSKTPNFRGIYVISLIVDDDPNFASSTTVHASGCNVIEPITKELSNIGPFLHNSDLDSVFRRRWVIDTPDFNAFRYVGKETVYFRVTYGFCVADLTLCQNSCSSSKRRKRSSEVEAHTMDLKMEVRGNDTDIHIINNKVNVNSAAKESGDKLLEGYLCATSPVVLVPSAMLLTIIFFQIAVAIAFQYVRLKYV